MKHNFSDDIAEKIKDLAERILFEERVSWMMWFCFLSFLMSMALLMICLPFMMSTIDYQLGWAIFNSDSGKVALEGYLAYAKVVEIFFWYFIVATVCNIISWLVERYQKSREGWL